ncbi:MAG TPA: type VI secretion system membrane subunit TssM [Acetobacteraceae bacterium]|nr:type VI secretion system membrane subunit TssM [Acetobacteraceae bacterium]
MFRVIHNVLRSRWTQSFLVVVVLAVLVWFCGPLLGFGQLHPLDSELVRWIVITLLFVLWLVSNLIHEIRAARRDRKLAAEVATGAASTPNPRVNPTESAAAEEIALLSERLRDALRTLSRTRIAGKSRKRLAAMPWYMLIGPPGTGKTTALLNCGLKFPLTDAPDSAQAVKGVGGTRNCDWWFTDDAVMIDTAGRYVTQDSEATVDSAAWLGFLRLLKKHRRRQPINGVIVALSLSDLSTLNEDERTAHARAVRRRVRELHDQLGVRMPIYVLFTKADLIAGFVELFGTMSREEREQVWGMTFPLDEGKDEAGAIAGFGSGFDALLHRLNDRMLERVQQEPDLQRRRLIYGFPQQLASLRTVAVEFLTECFRPSRLETRALLRGVYFTSGTQHGTPIDRLLGCMAKQFGLPRQAVSTFTGRGRSYFLARLVREVVFGEAALVGLDPKEERRARWINRAGYAGCGLVLVLLSCSWSASYFGNRQLIAEVHASSAIYNTQVTELVKRGPVDADLAAVLPALNTLRGIHGGYAEQDLSAPIALTFGLYQGYKLGSAANDAYVRALNGLLLPRMLARVETQMQSGMGNPDFLYQALKVYLILGRRGPLERDLVMQWFSADLLGAYPSEDDAAIRDALGVHADAMLRQPLTQLALSDALIAQARSVLNREPLAEYSYNRLMRSKRVVEIPSWTVAEFGGPGSGRVFQLRSGKGLDTGVAGIYTWEGYHHVFLPLLPLITHDIAEDAWVLGHPPRAVSETLRATAKLRRDVMGLYLDDYARRWDAMLADIALKRFDSLPQALDELGLLSAPVSPLRDLLLAIDQQTQLSRPAATDQAAAQAGARAARVGQSASGFGTFWARSQLTLTQLELANILSEAFGNDPSGKPKDPAQRVDEHFKTMHDFISGGDGRPSGLEASLAKIQQMYQNFNQVANAPNQGEVLLNQVAAGGGGGNSGAAAQLRDLTRDMPPPVAAMLQGVSNSGMQVETSGATQQIADAWRSKVWPLCEAAFNRYPIVASSSADVPVDDFSRLLAPGGAISQFFDQYLKSFVDTSQRPWRWLTPERVPLGLSSGALAEFESAAQIRDALFGTSTKVEVRFQLVPVALDPRIAQISVVIGGQTLVWNHGPTESVAFQWPGTGGKTLVRVTTTPADAGPAQVIENDGPWALLRLLDRARITSSGQPDRFRIVFTGAAGTASFDLNANSVNNPFTLAALRSFRCPPKL